MFGKKRSVPEGDDNNEEGKKLVADDDDKDDDDDDDSLRRRRVDEEGPVLEAEDHGRGVLRSGAVFRKSNRGFYDTIAQVQAAHKKVYAPESHLHLIGKERERAKVVILFLLFYLFKNAGYRDGVRGLLSVLYASDTASRRRRCSES